jgi:hypothetical protein
MVHGILIIRRLEMEMEMESCSLGYRIKGFYMCIFIYRDHVRYLWFDTRDLANLNKHSQLFG